MPYTVSKKYKLCNASLIKFTAYRLYCLLLYLQVTVYRLYRILLTVILLIGFVILMDLSKAFDTINHSLLLGKSNEYGFYKTSLKLMQNYLCNRQ